MGGEDVDHWARAADDWIRWARTPGHDAFWHYRDALSDFIGDGAGRTAIDIGCGEGRVARLLGERGWQVTAVDPVPRFLAAAREAGSADAYAEATATALPFPDGNFDLALCYNMLMDVADMPAAVTEAGRMLAPGGTLMISIVHPFVDRGRFEGDGPDAPFRLTGDYFATERFEAEVEEEGLPMTFAGWSHPLETYVAAIGAAGLAVTALREPRPGPDAARLGRWRRLPLFLWMKAQARAG